MIELIVLIIVLFIILLMLGTPIIFSLGIPVMIYFFFSNMPVEVFAHSLTTPLSTMYS
jgi:hypothetical protein